jgi:hypothetical protein
VTDAFAGIDVAFAKKKRLPLVVCTEVEGQLKPLPLRQFSLKPPAGRGNAKAIDDAALTVFAEETAAYLKEIEEHYGVKIRRIAIDAPSVPKVNGRKRRECECALDALGISCITTPSAEEFQQIRTKVIAHLAAGEPHTTISHANQLWMFVGFALFRRLSCEWPCLEVFPHAIAHALGASAISKKHSEGAFGQFSAVAKHTRWPAQLTEETMAKELSGIGFGHQHDRIDAYLSAWVASLEDQDREALGKPPDDVIWIPRLRA